jgi:hypothetical protein
MRECEANQDQELQTPISDPNSAQALIPDPEPGPEPEPTSTINELFQSLEAPCEAMVDIDELLQNNGDQNVEDQSVQDLAQWLQDNLNSTPVPEEVPVIKPPTTESGTQPENISTNEVGTQYRTKTRTVGIQRKPIMITWSTQTERTYEDKSIQTEPLILGLGDPIIM